VAHIIVVGNEKGGAGKSTVSMHVATALVRMGHKVGVLDLDLRQRSFARYVENRLTYCQRHGLNLATPDVFPLPEVDQASLAQGENIHDRRLSMAIGEMEQDYDFILIDCAGVRVCLSLVVYSLACTLVTPINDSFIDLDLLAHVDPETGEILSPSVYSEMVWNARQLRAQAGLAPIDWVVVRNRLAAQQMHNKKKMGDALEALSKRIGFRIAPGFGERVIFRELFPRGLTLLDFRDVGVVGQMNISNVAARQELREMVKGLNLPGVTVDF